MAAKRRPGLLNRRAFMAGAATTLAAAAATALHAPLAAINPDDPGKLAKRLDKVAGELGKARLDLERLRINPEDPNINPDDPGLPAIGDALARIKRECAAIDGLADDMLELLKLLPR